MLLAVVVARFGRTQTQDALADGCASLISATLVLVASVALFAIYQSLAASSFWRNAGLATLLASAPASTLALRYRGRRSIPRALTGSILALAGIVVWLTLNLRGPRGDWTIGEVALVLPAAAIALASAACVGWWSKSATVGNAIISKDH